MSVDSSDIFLYEDELILSGINLKFIKNAITKKKDLKFSFDIIQHQKDGEVLRKAVNIEIINY